MDKRTSTSRLTFQAKGSRAKGLEFIFLVVKLLVEFDGGKGCGLVGAGNDGHKLVDMRECRLRRATLPAHVID